MKRVFFLTLFSGIIMLLQCNREGEEELYYEPLVDGIYNIDVDEEQEVTLTIEPNKPVSASGQFNNGLEFTIEFESDALKSSEQVEAKIAPVNGIADMPSDFQFHFGYVFKPEGVLFQNPGRMKVELPQNVDIENFKGFFFQGGVPYGSQEAEIWSVKMTPLLFESENGRKYVIFEIPHFSGFLGISGGDFKCGDPLSTDNCEELKEILACYISGKEMLTSKDVEKVNGALRDWLSASLQWMEENPTEMDEDWEIELLLSEILCWKASALMFNNDLRPFDDLLNRVADQFTDILIDKLVEMNSQCTQMQNLGDQAFSYRYNAPYLNLIQSLSAAEMLNREAGIDHFNYCNSIASKYLTLPILDTTPDHIRSLYPSYYEITFEGEPSPAYARSKSITVFASNLLGEYLELKHGEDYTIEVTSSENFELNGTTITEEITTCYENYAARTGPYPCYPQHGHINLTIRLTTSGEFINIHAGRHLFNPDL